MTRLRRSSDESAPSDEELVDRVRNALVDVPDVVEKTMFGSVGFMVRGKLCLSARPERIMCRIDPETHSAALEHEGCETVVMKGQERRGYVYVDAASVEAKARLKYWVEQALKYNETLTGSAR